MAEYTRFTKYDWYAYIGAEKFTDGKDPFIYRNELNDKQVLITIVADGLGIEIYLTDNINTDSDVFDAWVKRFAQPESSMRVEGELKALIKQVETFTYAPDLTYCLDHPDRKEFENFEFSGNY